jgi:hypothetical protein
MAAWNIVGGDGKGICLRAGLLKDEYLLLAKSNSRTYLAAICEVSVGGGLRHGREKFN